MPQLGCVRERARKLRVAVGAVIEWAGTDIGLILEHSPDEWEAMLSQKVAKAIVATLPDRSGDASTENDDGSTGEL